MIVRRDERILPRDVAREAGRRTAERLHLHGDGTEGDVAFEELVLRAQPSRQRDVVCVHPREELAAARVDADRERARDPDPAAAHADDPWIDDVVAKSGDGVVDEDELVVGPHVREDALRRLSERRLAAMRKEDGDHALPSSMGAMLSRSAAALAAAFFFLFSSFLSPANAQSSHRSTPIGGRTTLMGGAGIADGRDGAAPFLNPATIERVGENRLTFSVNFYSLSFHSAERWYRPAEEGADAPLVDTAFDVLPSSLCLFFKTRGRLAVCLATTHGEEFVYASETRSGQAQTVRHRFTRVAFGPTYALKIDDNLALGVSLHGSVSSARNSFATSLASPARSTFTFASSRGTSAQLSAIVGATYRYGKQVFGLAVEGSSLHVYGSGGASRYVSDIDARTTASLAAEGDFRSQTPMRVGIGTAYVDKWGSAELDFSYFAPMKQAYRASLAGTAVDDANGTRTERAVSVEDSARARGVVNMNAGVEFFVTPSVSLVGGASVDVSSVSPGLLAHVFDYQVARSNRFTTSFGVGSRGEGGDVLFGTELSWATGERFAVDAARSPPSLVSTPQDTFRILFVFAGSTSFNAIRRTVRDVRQVLDPSKK